MLVLAHISDPHIDLSERNTARAAAVLRYLDGLPGSVDLVLVTGDIADNGLPEEYRAAAAVLAGRHPHVVCPGNHDSRGPFGAVLLGQDTGDRPINRVHRVADAVFLLCDSTIPGEPGGYLADETLAWLDDALGALAPDDRAFVCFHHPPLALGLPYVDAIRQTGADRLAEVLLRHDTVVAVLCGHAHTGAATTFAGLPLLVAPGIVSTLTLPWEGTEIVDYDLPPAVAFHLIDDDRRITTHYRVVPMP